MTKIDLPFANYQLPSVKSEHGLIAIIGEAPGADEIRQGRPFVGRSGQLLDKNLAEAGIRRAECLIANVFRYQPPQNKVAHFFISKKQALLSGEGMAEEYGKFGSRHARALFAPEIINLKKTLEEYKPAAIITLGGTPMWALTGQEGIVALHGQVMECRLVSGLKVIPTYHPSYIIRGNWSVEPSFLADLVKAKELAYERSNSVLKKSA
jgi:uracil-DNA glycosylase